MSELAESPTSNTETMMDEQTKQQAIAATERCALLNIWKRRLPADDWWEFAASERRPTTGEWHPASPNEIKLIAARALSSDF